MDQFGKKYERQKALNLFLLRTDKEKVGKSAHNISRWIGYMFTYKYTGGQCLKKGTQKRAMNAKINIKAPEKNIPKNNHHQPNSKQQQKYATQTSE